MSIKAVGFDIDGTLYKASSLYCHLIAKGATRLRLLLAFNEVRHELRRLITSEAYRASHPDKLDDFHRFQAGLVAAKLRADPDATHDAIEAFFYTASVDPFDTIPLYHGVPELLAALRGRGLRLGALSDFPCDRKLSLMGLADRFDVALTSEETGLVKPDRASFDLMARRLGVKNEEILYVGNSETYDVAGALGAGMRAALITNSRGAARRSAAEFTFSDFADLGRYIEVC